jgi:hypothetical protein
MRNAARVIAVIAAVLTYAQNFSSASNVAHTLGTGLVAITFAVLSLGPAD